MFLTLKRPVGRPVSPSETERNIQKAIAAHSTLIPPTHTTGSAEAKDVPVTKEVTPLSPTSVSNSNLGVGGKIKKGIVSFFTYQGVSRSSSTELREDGMRIMTMSADKAIVTGYMNEYSKIKIAVSNDPNIMT